VSVDQIKSAKEEILNHISFVHQHDEEFSNLKKERRAGRPASTREDVLKMKIAADEKEYENGFCEYLTSLNTPLANLFRYAGPYGYQQCDFFGQMGGSLGILVDTELGFGIERRRDKTNKVSTEGPGMMQRNILYDWRFGV